MNDHDIRLAVGLVALGMLCGTVVAAINIIANAVSR